MTLATAGITRIHSCRACGSSSIEPFLDLGMHPLANSLLASAETPEGAYELALTFCHGCAMVQLTVTVEPTALFSHYLWVTGTSSTARQQADTFCVNALNRLDQPGAGWICEVASNDGTFLRPFMARGLDVLGIDPAANIVKSANAAGVPTMCGFFGEKLAEDVVAERGTASIVIARNVVAHVADPIDFVRGLARIIGDTGIAAIEFHYGRKILEGLQYDSIYHEHHCYITAGTVVPLLERAGLEVFDFDEGPISGGALIVYARKSRGGRPMRKSVEAYLAAEKRDGINTIEVWRNFGNAVYRHREQLNACLDEEIAAGRRVVGYGASARSSTMLNFCGITSDRLPVIADQNPMKQGLYTAGSHILIRPPEQVFAEKPDTVLLLAWNFGTEIMGVLRDRFRYSGMVILPLPNAPAKKAIN